MKKFIAGFLTCAILIFTLLTFGFAEGILNVVLNPYPVYVNGSQVEVEGYNINDFIFLKLSDVGKCFDSTVLFNQTENRIDVNSNVTVLNMSATEDLISIVQFDVETENPVGAEFVEYKGCRVLKYNNRYYVSSGDLYKPFGIIPLSVDENNKMFKLGDKKVIVSSTDYKNIIKYRTMYLYDISLFSELIGE